MVNQENVNSSSQISDSVPIATCALLLEMANTDAEFSELEEEKIKNIKKIKNYRNI